MKKKLPVIMLMVMVAGILSACAPQEHRNFSLFRNKVVIETTIAQVPDQSFTIIFTGKGAYEVTFSNVEGHDTILPEDFTFVLDKGMRVKVIRKWEMFPFIVSVKHDGVTESVTVY